MFVIQDIKTKEYFWRYRIDEGFNVDISVATTFNSEEDALKDMQQEYLEELFEDRVIEVKKYFILKK